MGPDTDRGANLRIEDTANRQAVAGLSALEAADFAERLRRDARGTYVMATRRMDVTTPMWKVAALDMARLAGRALARLPKGTGGLCTSCGTRPRHTDHDAKNSCSWCAECCDPGDPLWDSDYDMD